MEIGILGLWHLGCVYSTGLAKYGYKVTGFDTDQQIVARLNKSTPPVFEPNLVEEINNHLNKNLTFTSDPIKAIKHKKYVFITLDVPVDNHDKLIIRPLNNLIRLVLLHCSPGTAVVVSSQVPVGTMRNLHQKLMQKNGSLGICFPENVRLGQAFKTFLKPDRIVLGIDAKSSLINFKKDFPIFNCPALDMSFESAEMVKHTLNSYLAVMISFASEVCDICELIGADYSKVLSALRSDSRVSPSAPLNPGIGFAGGTIGRDIQVLKSITAKLDYSPKLIKTAYQVNQDRLDKLINKTQFLLGNIKGKNIGLLGLTYKPGTDTLRRSKSLELAHRLISKGAAVRGYDPAIKPAVKLPVKIDVAENLASFFNQLDLAITMTPWLEFKNITADDLKPMKKYLVLDALNILSPDLKKQLPSLKYLRTGVSQ
ncbi:MAG: putative UDP-glucose 6-dehydrogenase [Candidatus Amesbacteria bacterium GW2011_GWB1_47_19]|nr:MAG: putative UDP-glucose 6-dehydrogenase [Candidatus Amesbacteria bacterium GW2011_GWA1_44_24]KKU31708.1 MAG: putative UDP-glucose 6-dehydrogenase [Candidatus Amesbacteria bacterium GW2011_GWC1_46_24]KKU67621.1 MAG: putative UDP-glucose 6-dehydrogenase [Candidatus Amesbacteria bacterium GW2011_GWB1_47_19]